MPRIELEALIGEDRDADTPTNWRQAAAEIVAALTPHLPTAECIPVDYTLMLIPIKYTQIHNLALLSGRNTQHPEHTLNIHCLLYTSRCV